LAAAHYRLRRMRTVAILPVKRFTKAKRRLGESVADPLRADLARAMVGDVLLALDQSAAIERTIVVTGEATVAAAAHRLGGLVVQDSAEVSQSAAVLLGVERALAEGFERVLCVPGDCPALDPAELDALLDRSRKDTGTPAAGERPTVVIVPDRHGTGTNGLLLSPPDAIAPSFGPDSRARHRASARAAGARWRIERPPSLLLDIDTGADLAALRKRLSGAPTGASRTRAVLGLPPHANAAPVAETG
jgi:2-phospho-L-lactate/phosphoenolpyruvate guanylyltransferase